MNAENLARLVSRVQIKAILHRQAEIRPHETMFDGVAPVGYAAGTRPIPTTASIGTRLESIERWFDDHPAMHRGRPSIKRRVEELEEEIPTAFDPESDLGRKLAELNGWIRPGKGGAS